MSMKKLVLKLNIHDDKDKQKAIKSVSSFSGIDLISVDMKQSQLTLIGEVDPVEVVSKLRKQWQTDIVMIGPAKEEKGGKQGGGGDSKTEGDKKPPIEIAHVYYGYPYPAAHTSYHIPAEENPNACVIC
ncbi:hypothetical protein Dimus_030886 [Dionaea muscipula]